MGAAERMEPLGTQDACATSSYYPSLAAAAEVAAVACAHGIDCVAVALLSGDAVLHYDFGGAAAGDSRQVVLRAHEDALTSVAWSQDDVVLVTGSLDRTVRVWCEQTAVCLHVLTRTGLQPASAGLAPGRVVVPKRCQGGTFFDVVAARDTDRAELATPGGNPSVEVLAPGTRVFEVLAPCVPIVSMEAPPMSLQPNPSLNVLEERACVVVGMLEQGEALILPPLHEADEADLRCGRHGRVKLPTTLCYEALRPRPKSWERFLTLGEMERGDHLQAPRPLLGQASVAAAPLLRDGRPVAVRAADGDVLYSELKSGSLKELERNLAALGTQIKPEGHGASGELRGRSLAIQEFIAANRRVLKRDGEVELLREVLNPQVKMTNFALKQGTLH